MNTVQPAEFLKFMRELVVNKRAIRDATEVLAGHRGEKAGILKRAKNSGVDTDALALLQKLMEMEDDDRNRLLENTYLYGGWQEVSLYVLPTEERPQGSLFGDDVDAAEAAEDLKATAAFNEGYDHGRDGGVIEDNPYHVGSRIHVMWAEGFAEAEKLGHGRPARGVKASAAKKPAKEKAAKAEKEPKAAKPKPAGKPARGKRALLEGPPIADDIGETAGSA